MGIVVVRPPKCLRGLLRKLFGGFLMVIGLRELLAKPRR